MSVIKCLYSCDDCGIERAAFEVAERAEGEDIGAWMEKVTAAVSADHQTRSGGCPSRKLRELMIPVPKGTERVGEVVRS